ncbi:hypothetical protein ACJJH9_00145 (plasmid) [Microbulbifer sp. DLAB2-AF]|uniref:hypothetical protein n=1 Tax=Microbulbifer sp. DLAB2-AF TaxID=3243395 RepID=UPI00403A00FD
MQFTIRINQACALEWGLNVKQAVLFDYLWAQCAALPEGEIYLSTSKTEILEDLPLLTDKPDTAYRLLCQLQKLGLISYTKRSGRDLIKITDLRKTWGCVE